MKRAALIITDRERFSHDAEGPEDGVRPLRTVTTDPQLLADLRTLVEKAERHPVVKSVADAVARVRALLPEGDEGE
jgi:hypothetical protein